MVCMPYGPGEVHYKKYGNLFLESMRNYSPVCRDKEKMERKDTSGPLLTSAIILPLVYLSPGIVCTHSSSSLTVYSIKSFPNLVKSFGFLKGLIVSNLSFVPKRKSFPQIPKICM